ncbi:ADP-ribosylation/Crystallin J1 [Ferroglobus placidus DSM 10642]|uniref:ADP-ribosylation/Crystallin J1 n=1 Tax=Ferroglobus placidus (strain DSM 10642 / AEDII12DO) TaxID=589924 RepID=D3S2M7_FERPA|nr:ADP-ribosylglycohydrolase family protein [Ferroglobus placidus]ADC64557.1 ADP-ribosylation/Crystallin J1 [Ferroglobus placidus DSM 10642]
MIDQFRGCILGLAIGDALGMPYEGSDSVDLNELAFRDSPFGDLKAGEYTDDTEQTIMLAESIIETIYFSPENFAEKLKRADFRRRYGPTSRRAISRLQMGASWKESGVESDTCGAAMRVAPIGLVYHFNYSLVENYCSISSMITHKGRGAIAGAVAVGVAVAMLINEDFNLEELLGFVSKHDSFLAEKIEYAYEIRDKDERAAAKEIGNSIMSYDVVPLAFYCFFSSKNYVEGVKKAIKCGGDTDTAAAITGAFFGTRDGYSSIPEALRKVENHDYLLQLADKLYETYLKIASIVRK